MEGGEPGCLVFLKSGQMAGKQFWFLSLCSSRGTSDRDAMFRGVMD